MKNRKGFGKIDIGGKKFLFNWAKNLDGDGPLLVMYDEDDNKVEIPYSIWNIHPDSDEYTSGPGTWHGKHKRGPEWGGWGKRQAREMYRKYLKFISI